MNLDIIMAELAQYIRMQEEAAAMVESLKDQLKERMTAALLLLDPLRRMWYNRNVRRCPQ